jgi:hypothetical protein
MTIERRVQIAEILGVLLGRQPARRDPFLEKTFRHGAGSPLLFSRKLARFIFLSIGQILIGDRKVGQKFSQISVGIGPPRPSFGN